ncbi:MAG: glutamine amidotransferase [Planctomycetaceae bacterium]|jgi:uncharacterized membrane protein|nr:glutamine amidotransferase [Planctomycetaceae bacterium]MDG2389788.1 glutamine amidotransferase [Planctomycetaceae bacterium]
MKMVFSPIMSWPATLLIAAALGFVIWWSYRPKLKRLSPFRGRLLLTLRATSLLVLLLVMLRPSLEFTSSETEGMVLIIAGDSSRSMETPDGLGSQSRRQALLNTLNENQETLEGLSEKVTILRYDFDETLVERDKLDLLTTGEQTAVGASLEKLLQETGNERVVGVLLMTDGAQRAFAPLNIDPRTIALRYGEQRIPIHPVPFGGTGQSENALDLVVEELFVDPIAFEKTTIPVTIRLRALGAAGRKIRVKLLVEERRGRAPGDVGTMGIPLITGDDRPVKEITINSSNEVQTIDLSFTPQTTGEFKLRVEAEPLSKEVKTVNNSRETIITVQKGGIRVAYLHSIPPEAKFILKVGGTEQIQIESNLMYLGALQKQNRIPDDWFEPNRFDVYMIGDIPAELLSDEQMTALAERVSEDGAGLMMLGGLRSFGPGGYAGTPLEKLLPVVMKEAEKSDGRVSPDLHYFRDLQMRPTPRGRSHYLMRLDNSANPAEIWSELPPLQKANKLQKRHPLVQVLAESEEGAPLLFAQEFGPARVLAFAGDTTWLWHLNGFQEEHTRFWQQIILWLSRKELDSDSSVWARVDPRNFRLGQRVPITFGARNDRGEPLADAIFQVTVKTPDGNEFSPSLLGSGGERRIEVIDTDQPGDYWVKIDAIRDGQPVGPTAWTRFLIDAGDPELDNPAADFQLLEEIAKLSGGSMIPPEDLDDYLKQLQDERLPSQELTEIRRTSLWDNSYVMILFVVIISSEWFLRKKNGLV